VNARDFRLLGEPVRQVQRIGAMPFHPQRERLQATQREKAVERAEDSADGVLQISETVCQRTVTRLGADHDHAADNVGVAVQVLGCRVNDDIEAELQRPLNPWAGKGVVGDGDEITLAGDPGDRGKIDQLEQGNRAGSAMSTKLTLRLAERLRTFSNRRYVPP